jgi:protein required for attachment to host cells
MIIPYKTTIAVVDGRRFRLFRNEAIEPHIHLVELNEPDLDHQNPGSGHRHRSAATNPDLSRHEEDDFAAAATNRLNRLAIGGRVEALFLIADPRTLGEMRRHYNDALRALLLGELDKDFAGATIPAIERALVKA